MGLCTADAIALEGDRWPVLSGVAVFWHPAASSANPRAR
ncbi:hypothetical protein CKA32_007070 [Geitlerinema sp. FC II]|nr:hypothetical protein CKA32_007070 [Geitlerinema sp. FC II]